MGFTVETRAGPALAIKAGKNNRTPVFVDLETLARRKGKERMKFLKEEADRSAALGEGRQGARSGEDSRGRSPRRSTDRRRARLAGKHASPPGTPLLQPTDERRRTGSHYTPRTLTEPIVRHALEPAFERLGPDATPEQCSSSKSAIRRWAPAPSWSRPAARSATRLVAGVDALARDAKPTIPPDEDEQLHARRLVAQRCLYGVDKNPLAADLAKLSLWLATLARDHEFTFLDHALKWATASSG